MLSSAGLKFSFEKIRSFIKNFKNLLAYRKFCWLIFGEQLLGNPVAIDGILPVTGKCILVLKFEWQAYPVPLSP